jgi:hypothetical protein
VKNWYPYLILCFWLVLAGQEVCAQNKDIFIPIANRPELKLFPDIDTLEDGTDYYFRLAVADGYKISQSFFDRGLATLIDTTLIIVPKVAIKSGTQTASIRFIVHNGSRMRVLLMKEFVVKSNGKLYPTVQKPKSNIITLNSSTVLERNKTYNKKTFLKAPKINFYDSDKNDTSRTIRAVRMSIVKGSYERHMRSTADTLTREMITEIKKIKGQAQVFICLEIPQPRNVIKSVWSRFFVTD